MPKFAPAAAVAALAVAVLLPNLPALHAPQEDAGVFLYVARTIGEGGMPYRDVWDHKPPLVYLLDLLGLALGGTLGVWALEAAALAAAAWLGFAALAPAFGRRAALVASCAWVLAAPRLILVDGLWSNYAELFAVPAQLAALRLFTVDDARRPGWRTAAIGALGGLALLLKPTLGGIVVAIALRMTWTRLRRRDGRDLAARLALLAAGGALPVALVAAWLASGGALADAVDQALRYNVANAGTATLEARLAAIALGLRLTAPNGLAVLALAGAALALLRHRREPLAQLALVGLPVEALLASTSGRPYHYYYLPWLWMLTTLAACAILELERWLARTGRTTAPALALLALAVAAQPALLVVRTLREPDQGLARAGVAYLAASTRPGDTVLFWGSRTEVLFLADRRAPTRYVYQYGPLFTVGYATVERVSELERDLARRPPALIIDESGTAFATPPLDAAALRRGDSPEERYRPLPETARIAEWVAAGYERAGAVPGAGWPVWRRR